MTASIIRRPMPDYRIRLATLDDLDALVHHRVAMFTDMGVAVDVPALDAAFRAWLHTTMPAGEYVAWVTLNCGKTTLHQNKVKLKRRHSNVYDKAHNDPPI